MPPVFDAASQQAANATTALSGTHVCSGTNRGLLVGVINRSPTASAITAITYNAVPLEAISGGDSQASPDARVRLYRLVNPDAGSHLIDIAFATVTDAAYVAASYTDVHQTTPLGTAAINDGGPTTTATVDVSSAAGELVVAVACAGILTSIVAGAGQTERSEILTGACDGELSEEAGAPTVTMSYTLDPARIWATAGVSLKPAASFLTVRLEAAP